MTKDKDFKRLVRSRASRTGESYQRSRRQLRPDSAADHAALDESTQTNQPFADNERALGDRIADMALRMADGKARVPIEWPQEMTDLLKTLSNAERAAQRPEATDQDRQRAQDLQRQFAAAQEQSRDLSPRWTPDEYLAHRVGDHLRVALVARAKCQELLVLNPRDPVAGSAHEKLSAIALSILERSRA